MRGLGVIQRGEFPLRPRNERRPCPGIGPFEQDTRRIGEREIGGHEHHPRHIARHVWFGHRPSGQRAARRGADDDHALTHAARNLQEKRGIIQPIARARRGHRRTIAPVARQPRKDQICTQRARHIVGHRADFLGACGKPVQIQDRQRRDVPRRTRPNDPRRVTGANIVKRPLAFGKKAGRIVDHGQVAHHDPLARQKPEDNRQRCHRADQPTKQSQNSTHWPKPPPRRV